MNPQTVVIAPIGDTRSSLTRSALLLFAVAAGVSVANVYFAQPLLDELSIQFGFDTASAGLVVTVTQIGYALGLF